MAICKAHETCPREGGSPCNDERYNLRRSDEGIWDAGKQGDCHASLATSAADGRFSTAS